jgi:rhamnosyltransferase
VNSLPEYDILAIEPKLNTRSVCGVMVTYHPNRTMLEHVRTVMAEVKALVVVDNGSSSHAVDALKNASTELGFHLIPNGRNVGIAEALNQGVRWAEREGYPWVLLMDQDSRIREGFVNAMLRTWMSHPQREKIASLYPLYMHPELGVRPLAPRARDGSHIWCMTSGTLMPTWIFDKIGCFASEFFIDWVDIEYCFRIRKAGYLLVEAGDAILVHDPGQATPVSILGLRFWPSHHSAVRRYYMSRNRIVVFRKYFFRLPLGTLKAMHAALRDTAKCFLGERDRLRKIRNFLIGTWDGLTGRMGERADL